MRLKIYCRWYDETSAMKRAYDMGLLEKKCVKDYCWNGGKGCIRKKRFEEEGYVSPDYDMGLLEKKWVKDYCWNGGKGCIRKKRFEEEGYVSPDYVLPDGSEDPELKECYKKNY